jgi:NADH dehydrogenase
MSKASQEDTLQALTKLGVVKLNTTVVDYKDDIIVVMEKPFKLKI